MTIHVQYPSTNYRIVQNCENVKKIITKELYYIIVYLVGNTLSADIEHLPYICTIMHWMDTEVSR